jgi:hypothetical protein
VTLKFNQPSPCNSGKNYAVHEAAAKPRSIIAHVEDSQPIGVMLISNVAKTRRGKYATTQRNHQFGPEDNVQFRNNKAPDRSGAPIRAPVTV